MPNNFLITGRPGSGKTSIVERVISILRERGLSAGGLYCPEIRERGVRLGFKIVDLMTGEARILAHVDQREGPRVSKYRVNVANVDALSETAIQRALRNADFVVIDEIAPMELHSEGFRRSVRDALDSSKPLLAIIHQRTTTGFIGSIKSRPDVEIFEVTPGAHADLPGRLAEKIERAITESRFVSKNTKPKISSLDFCPR